MADKANLFAHMKCINECISRFGLEATVNVRNFQLEVRGRNRYFHMVPQYVYFDEGRMRYTPHLRSDSKLFLGWLPYFNKRWPLAIDKLGFKEFCSVNNLRTPAYWLRADDSVRDFIVKQRASSFGYGIRGPFRSIDPSDRRCRLAEDEYYEKFQTGKIAKIWYWNEKPVCLEMRDMPTVSGNGVQSLYELMQARVGPGKTTPGRLEVDALASYQGLSLDEIVRSGRTVLADFRYGSGLLPVSIEENLNALPQRTDTRIGRQLVEAGPVFWNGIPEETRRTTLFTMDAIVDDEEQVWFLEMNCNPMGHPDVYFPMFESLFGPEQMPASDNLRSTLAPPPIPPGAMPAPLPGVAAFGAPVPAGQQFTPLGLPPGHAAPPPVAQQRPPRPPWWA